MCARLVNFFPPLSIIRECKTGESRARGIVQGRDSTHLSSQPCHPGLSSVSRRYSRRIPPLEAMQGRDSTQLSRQPRHPGLSSLSKTFEEDSTSLCLSGPRHRFKSQARGENLQLLLQQQRHQHNNRAGEEEERHKFTPLWEKNPQTRWEKMLGKDDERE